MDQLTTQLLAAQRGDRAALERFVTATHHDVVVVCRYLGDQDNAEDLAQEVYERAINSLHRFRATGPAKHWLLTIARRTCADATRKRSRRRRIQQRLAALPHDDRDDAAPLGDRAELDELMQDLDDERRAAFVLTQVVGLHYDEAAELLGVPIGTIRSRVSRAREQLITALASAEIGGVEEPPAQLRRPYG